MNSIYKVEIEAGRNVVRIYRSYPYMRQDRLRIYKPTPSSFLRLKRILENCDDVSIAYFVDQRKDSK